MFLKIIQNELEMEWIVREGSILNGKNLLFAEKTLGSVAANGTFVELASGGTFGRMIKSEKDFLSTFLICTELFKEVGQINS